MFNFKELTKVLKEIDSFNKDHKSHYRMSFSSDNEGVHITVIDIKLEKIYSWQPFESVEELHDFIIETCW